MDNSNVPQSLLTEHTRYDAETVRRALNLQRAQEEHERRYPHLRPVGQLACALAHGLEMIQELEELAEGKSGPIDENDPDDLRWQDLLAEMAGWRWAHHHALDLLRSQFTHDVEEALYHGDFLDEEEHAVVRAQVNARYVEMPAEGEEDDAQAVALAIVHEPPADVPAIRDAELPAQRDKPYWLQ